MSELQEIQAELFRLLIAEGSTTIETVRESGKTIFKIVKTTPKHGLVELSVIAKFKELYPEGSTERMKHAIHTDFYEAFFQEFKKKLDKNYERIKNAGNQKADSKEKEACQKSTR